MRRRVGAVRQVQRAGHFLQRERAGLFNRAISCFLGDPRRRS
ncbi:MAG TPA: hypothetical protein VK778_15540 [Solirubrobacteraceae bacterium]|nr:hypothetical protein [Solirubrobacteraceae bacterium]